MPDPLPPPAPPRQTRTLSKARRVTLPALKAALPEGAAMVHQTLLPPEKLSARVRMAMVVALMAAIMWGGYMLTGRVLWAFVVLVVGVPVVALPTFILVGIVIQAREELRRGASLDDGHID